MNTCPYCGAKYPDDVTECPIDHTRMVELPPKPSSEIVTKSSRRGIPFFGVASLLAPIIGFIYAWNVATPHGDVSAETSIGLFLEFAGIMFVALFLGFLAALISLFTCERWRGLP